MFMKLFFISLLLNSKLIDNILIEIIVMIGTIVQIISIFWFCNKILLLNLFFRLNFIIVIRIKIILIKIINIKLWNMVSFIRLIELGFWKFILIHDIIL